MDQQQLLHETHELLKRLLEMDEERKRESAEAMASFQEKFKSPLSDSSDSPKESDFQVQHDQRMLDIQSDMEVLRKKDQEYKEAVLAEYQEQTRILTEILERLKK